MAALHIPPQYQSMANPFVNQPDPAGHDLGPFAVSDDLSHFLTSPAEFIASREDVDKVIAGAMVFRPDPNSNLRRQTLLLRRAPSDSFPLQWEVPAGTADPALDHSIVGVAVRELWEETHLQARRVFATVGMGPGPSTASQKLIGDIADARMDSQGTMCLLRFAGLTWAIVTFLTDVEDENAKVILQEDEHVEWAWVTKDEVEKGSFSHDSEKPLDLVSEPMKLIILEGFRLMDELAGESCGRALDGML